MSMIIFKLDMPNRGSWNGGWSGEDEIHAIIKRLSNTKKSAALIAKLIENGPYSYSWSDGWRASISVEEVSAAEARKLRKRIKGFCGYDWMVADILTHGEIRGD